MGTAAKAYLLAYNLAQTAGWALVLAQTLRALAADGNADGVYAAAGATVRECRRMHTAGDLQHPALRVRWYFGCSEVAEDLQPLARRPVPGRGGSRDSACNNR